MTDHLVNEIKNIANFSNEDITLFSNSFKEILIRKGDHFLQEGEISKYLGYIKGKFRL